ncbi:hypothetical protein [Ornithinibacillus halotolerans]|uniref:Uncharacterized protein n=1 Tax=Ornithinibacillus halotolerans TaxID=1274357 RepID=A0A916S1U4_9BACI|nr:hypothetical protein [Ornithinibacillus halotolerans]GGA80456.1 hypothetical protein GCM10008025_24830 [Ornithinibacillus halotolerans]
MIHVHDHQIISYSVHLEKKTINLQTQSQSGGSLHIVFSHVLAHLFENHLPGSIILDIEKSNIELFLHENKELLEENKDYSWPIDYNELNELKVRLIEEEYNYYILSASYGMSGWVLAKDVDLL